MNIEFDWSDKKLKDKANAHFMALYELLPKAPAKGKLPKWPLSAANEVQKLIYAPVEPTTDPKIAAVIVVNRYLLNMTFNYLTAFIFLGLKDAQKVFDERDYFLDENALYDLSVKAALADMLLEQTTIKSLLRNNLDALNLAATQYFDLLNACYPVKELAAVRTLFAIFINRFGQCNLTEHMKAFAEARRKLGYAIFDYAKNAGTNKEIIAQLGEIRAKLTEKAKRPRTSAQRKGSGLKGKRTKTMDEQLSDFSAWVLDGHPIGAAGSVYARAQQYWHEHKKAMEKAKLATGEGRGFAIPKILADAYRNQQKKRGTVTLRV